MNDTIDCADSSPRLKAGASSANLVNRDDSVFDAVSELFALDVRPHLIPLPMQESFCINLD